VVWEAWEVTWEVAWQVAWEAAKGEAKAPPIAFTGREAFVPEATAAATTTISMLHRCQQVTGHVPDAVTTSLLAIPNAVSAELRSQQMREAASEP